MIMAKIRAIGHCCGRFISLSAARKRVLIEAVGIVLIVRAALALFSLKQIIAALHRLASRKPGRKTFAQDDILYALAVIARWMPFATCLVSGLAGQYLLSRNGFHPTLHIGVKKETDKMLMAHAWVTIEQQVVVGMIDDLHTYAPLQGIG